MTEAFGAWALSPSVAAMFQTVNERVTRIAMDPTFVAQFTAMLVEPVEEVAAQVEGGGLTRVTTDALIALYVYLALIVVRVIPRTELIHAGVLAIFGAVGRELYRRLKTDREGH